MVALGLLRAYEAGGMPYLCFPAREEEQRVRNKRRKFPAPPDEEEPLAAKIPCPRRITALSLRGKTLDRELLSIDRGLSA